MAANTEEKKETSDKKEEPPVPLSVFESCKFEKPSKRICIEAHIPKFQSSPTYKKVLTFLTDLGDACKGFKVSDKTYSQSSPIIIKLSSLLSTLNDYADQIEPLKSATRYGNKAYRMWQDKMIANSKSLIFKLFPDHWTKTESKNTQLLYAMTDEINGYLLGSFGDYTRIDYGSGHELTFICFLLVLSELKLICKSDYTALVLVVFNSYLRLMRKVQVRYALEPAGSKGVWGLDDYQFLSFYFGAAQLRDNKALIEPKDVRNAEILMSNDNEKEWMYLGCIVFILEMKTGLFAEHSPFLNDISHFSKNWHKVTFGLITEYQKKVLVKLPIVQHFLFGSILTIDLPKADAQNNDNEKAHILKRKQALIDKLNAKNKKKKKEKKLNEKQNKQNDQNDMVVTKAPWAK